MWCMTAEEIEGEPVEVWPSNIETVNVFVAMATQWRVAMGGCTGLDYNALPGVMRIEGVPRANWPEVFEGIRIMEDEALKTMRENRSTK